MILYLMIINSCNYDIIYHYNKLFPCLALYYDIEVVLLMLGTMDMCLKLKSLFFCNRKHVGTASDSVLMILCIYIYT